MAQKPKMLTCTCGNTELDRISVRLPLTNGRQGESLALVALRCGGSGCGRVTFRPDENANAETQPEKPAEKTPEKAQERPIPTNGHVSANGNGPRNIAELFERVYKERLVYKAIAERDPNCPQLFEALKNNPQVCAGINSAFGQVYQRLEAKEDLFAALQTLPSMAISE